MKRIRCGVFSWFGFSAPRNRLEKMSRVQTATLLFLAAIASVRCGPKYDGFVPSSIDYMEKSSKAQDQIAMPSQADERKDVVPKYPTMNPSDDRNQEPRFGFTNVGTASGYGVSPYGPGKVDLGGLLLGAVLGVGTILIIPKLLYVLSGSYGNYARSEDAVGYAQMLAKLDDALARHGIDTTSCMQRMICSYTQQAADAISTADSTNIVDNGVSTIDKLIDSVASNQMLHSALQGTAVQEAMENGKVAGQNCGRVYHHCTFSTETMLSLLSNVIASVATTANNAKNKTPAPAAPNAL